MVGTKGGVRRTAGRLADGREIIFFDTDDSAPPRKIDDPRDLPVTATLTEVRYDAVLDEWVAMASHRQNRTHLPPVDDCPLCPSRDGRQTEIPADDYQVVVFENRFPSFAEPGRCEVLCFTSDHDATLAGQGPDRLRLVLEAWVDRTRALSARADVEQVFCFENRGEEIGVTLRHPHGQIYAYPFVTPKTRQMLAVARSHRDRTGRNLFEEVLAAELADGSRVVTEGEHWVAFVPVAARWPVEVHLYPRRRAADLPSLTEAERDDFARVYLDVLRAMDALYDAPLPYVSAWHQAPGREGRDLAYLHLQLFSIKRAANKVKYLAGSESGMGVFVNDVLPEQSAAGLRAALPTSAR